MKYRLLPGREQVMVITGASSGIGLVTAKRAATRGAGLVLAARNANDLRAACNEIRQGGGRAGLRKRRLLLVLSRSRFHRSTRRKVPPT